MKKALCLVLFALSFFVSLGQESLVGMNRHDQERCLPKDPEIYDRGKDHHTSMDIPYDCWRIILEFYASDGFNEMIELANQMIKGSVGRNDVYFQKALSLWREACESSDVLRLEPDNSLYYFFRKIIILAHNCAVVMNHRPAIQKLEGLFLQQRNAEMRRFNDFSFKKQKKKIFSLVCDTLRFANFELAGYLIRDHRHDEISVMSSKEALKILHLALTRESGRSIDFIQESVRCFGDKLEANAILEKRYLEDAIKSDFPEAIEYLLNEKLDVDRTVECCFERINLLDYEESKFSVAVLLLIAKAFKTQIDLKNVGRMFKEYVFNEDLFREHYRGGVVEESQDNLFQIWLELLASFGEIIPEEALGEVVKRIVSECQCSCLTPYYLRVSKILFNICRYCKYQSSSREGVNLLFENLFGRVVGNYFDFFPDFEKTLKEVLALLLEVGDCFSEKIESGIIEKFFSFICRRVHYLSSREYIADLRYLTAGRFGTGYRGFSFGVRIYPGFPPQTFGGRYTPGFGGRRRDRVSEVISESESVLFPYFLLERIKWLCENWSDKISSRIAGDGVKLLLETSRHLREEGLSEQAMAIRDTAQYIISAFNRRSYCFVSMPQDSLFISKSS